MNVTASLLNPVEVLLFGFLGAGRGSEHFIDSGDPLIYAGHVGVSWDGGNHIYGFTPYAPGISFSIVIRELKRQRLYPGQVNDDALVFHRAQDLAEQQLLRTQVYVWRQHFGSFKVVRMRRIVRKEARTSLLLYKEYCFPQDLQVCYNCATWPATLGVAIPEQTGELRNYIPALAARGELWQRS